MKLGLNKIRNALVVLTALGASFVGGEYHMAGKARKQLTQQKQEMQKEKENALEELKTKQADDTRDFRSAASKAFLELKLLRNVVNRKAASDAEFERRVRRALPWPAPWLEPPRKQPGGKTPQPKKPGLKNIPDRPRIRGKGVIT